MARYLSIQARDEAPARFFESDTALRRVLIEAPYYARCSDNKTAARIRPRVYAIRYPYMQINRPGMVSWLIFDLDHENPHVWEDQGLPAPNLIVSHPESGHSHIYYAIPPVCTSETARAKPIEYMKAVYEAFALRLQADPDFHSGPVAKTPGHPWWRTTELHGHIYELGELADYVDLSGCTSWAKSPKLEEVGHSRHCSLFEWLRHYAYSTVRHERQNGSFQGFVSLLELYAHKRNSFAQFGFSEDLPWSSVKATVKSVARWTWTHYTGSRRCNRGAMQIDRDLPLAERQKLAAERTHAIRREATESRIRAVCEALKRKGQALTQSAVASATQLARQTVAMYKHVLASVAAGGKILQKAKVSATVPDVNYGVHQVPARIFPFPWRGAGAMKVEFPDSS
jgi:hypothetical protein